MKNTINIPKGYEVVESGRIQASTKSAGYKVWNRLTKEFQPLFFPRDLYIYAEQLATVIRPVKSPSTAELDAALYIKRGAELKIEYYGDIAIY